MSKKKREHERKRMSQRVTNYVGFWQIVALLYKSSNISFVTVWSVTAGTGVEGPPSPPRFNRREAGSGRESHLPRHPRLICFNWIVCQLDESIHHLSLIGTCCVFVKLGVESGRRDFQCSAAWTEWPPGGGQTTVCKPSQDPTAPTPRETPDKAGKIAEGHPFGWKEVGHEIKALCTSEDTVLSKVKTALALIAIIFQMHVAAAAVASVWTSAPRETTEENGRKEFNIDAVNGHH